MSLTSKVAYNTVVQIIGKVITTLISLVLVGALTRYLGVAGYGQYTTIFAYLAFFGVLADFGLFWIFVREIAKPDVDFKKATSNILTLRIVIGIFIYGLATILALFIPQYDNFHSGIAIIAIASLFLALNSTYVGIFQNKLRMDKAVITDIVGRIIILLLTLYLIKLNHGLNLILWAYAVGNVVNFVLSAYLGRVYVAWRPAFDLPYWKILLKNALPMAIVLILGMLFFKIDTLMLSLMKSSTDVGIYGPPYKILEILILLPAIFMGNIFPIVTRYIYEGDTRLQSALQKSFDFLMILAWPIMIGIIFTASRIIKLMAGADFAVAQTIAPILGHAATSALTLQILAVAVALSFISHLFGYLVIALGKQEKMIKPYVILVVINVALNLLIIPKYSYIGAAITTVVTEVLGLIFAWYVARKYVNLRFNLKVVWQTLFATAFLGVFLYIIGDKLNLILLIISSLMVYTVALYAVGAVSYEMFLNLIPSKKKEMDK